MIEKIAVHLTNKLAEVIECDEKEYEVYIYGFETLLGQIIIYTLLLLTGILLKSLPQVIVYTLFFVVLQGQTGGYHAKTHAGCISRSWAISTIAMVITKFVSLESFFLVLPILIVSIIYIYIKAPINHIKLDLSLYEMKHLRKLSRCVLLLEITIIFIFIIMKFTTLVVPACLAIITVAILMKIAKILKQEVMYYGNES